MYDVFKKLSSVTRLTRAASIDGLVPFLVAWLLCQINIIIISLHLSVVYHTAHTNIRN